MNEIGYAALLLAFVSTGYGTVASIVGARTGRWEYVKSAERAVYAYCASVSVAGFALFYALLSSDFSNEYVYQYTSLDLSWFYKASAFWAGNSGSMLLWLLILGIFGAIVIRQNRTKNRELIPYVISIISFIGFFFALLMLTRSGTISSVHSFGQGSLGPYFLAFIGLTLVLSLNLLFSRLDHLKSRNELDSFISRESSFLLNNLILVGMAFTVLWGVLFPILSEAVTGDKITVGPPFFDQVMAPIGLVLMFLVGICPLIAWRRATLANLGKNFMYPGSVALATLVVLLAMGMRHVYALISFTLVAFVLATIILEFARGTWVRRQMSGQNLLSALASLTWRNKRRYGGYTVHLGIVLILVGVTGSYAFKQEVQETLTPGDTVAVGEYELTYQDFSTYDTSEKRVGTAEFSLTEDGQPLGVVRPVREFYFLKDQPWTRVDRHSTLSRDVYVSLLQYSGEGEEIKVQVDINPLINWLWIGGFVVALGALIAMWPDSREQSRLAARYERQARLHEV